MKTSTSLLIVCVVVGYLLSPPFVVRMAIMMSQEGWVRGPISAFYAPAYSFANAFPPYMRLLEWEFRLLTG